MNDRPTYDLLKQRRNDAVQILYERYGRKLYSYGISHWNLDEDSSWELVYQTLYKLVETFDRYEFENEAKFGAFIFKMFVNYLRNHYRDTKRRKEQLDFVNFDESNFENYEAEGKTSREVKKRIAEASEEEFREEEAPQDSIPMAMLRKELEQLEDWQRMLLLMRGQNMPYSEISKHVNKPETQLKVYYQRLKDRIMKKLSPQLQTIIKN